MPGENIQDWSTTAASNATSDSSIDWTEGQARATVNNSARAMMAAHAKDRNLKNGSITTAGTANAQTFSSGLTYSSVPTNLNVRLKIGAALTNTTTATLNMDSIGAVTIKYPGGTELGAGALVAGSYADFVYNGTNWILLASVPAVAPPEPAATSGRLQYVSTTALSFLPYGGSLIKINGSFFDIPSTGVVGLANTNVYVGGVAAQNLASDTTYYVYAFSNSGVVTADFSTTAHATSTTSGNLGVEIKSGDDTRTLLGMIRTSGTTFADSETGNRLVRSWFNRSRETLVVSANGASFSGSLTAFGSSAKFLCWDDEAVQYALSAYGQTNDICTIATQIYIDGVVAPNSPSMNATFFTSVSGLSSCSCSGQTRTLSEGMHTVQAMAAYTGAGSGFSVTGSTSVSIG